MDIRLSQASMKILKEFNDAGVEVSLMKHGNIWCASPSKLSKLRPEDSLPVNHAARITPQDAARGDFEGTRQHDVDRSDKRSPDGALQAMHQSFMRAVQGGYLVACHSSSLTEDGQEITTIECFGADKKGQIVKAGGAMLVDGKLYVSTFQKS